VPISTQNKKIPENSLVHQDFKLKLQKKMFATKNFLFTKKKVFFIDFDWMWVAFK